MKAWTNLRTHGNTRLCWNFYILGNIQLLRLTHKRFKLSAFFYKCNHMTQQSQLSTDLIWSPTERRYQTTSPKRLEIVWSALSLRTYLKKAMLQNPNWAPGTQMDPQPYTLNHTTLPLTYPVIENWLWRHPPAESTHQAADALLRLFTTAKVYIQLEDDLPLLAISHVVSTNNLYEAANGSKHWAASMDLAEVVSKKPRCESQTFVNLDRI